MSIGEGASSSAFEVSEAAGTTGAGSLFLSQKVKSTTIIVEANTALIDPLFSITIPS